MYNLHLLCQLQLYIVRVCSSIKIAVTIKTFNSEKIKQNLELKSNMFKFKFKCILISNILVLLFNVCQSHPVGDSSIRSSALTPPEIVRHFFFSLSFCCICCCSECIVNVLIMAFRQISCVNLATWSGRRAHRKPFIMRMPLSMP